MGNRSEKDVENLIRNSAFPNPAHKERLREQLRGLSVLPPAPDDLDAVAGGLAWLEAEDLSALSEAAERMKGESDT